MACETPLEAGREGLRLAVPSLLLGTKNNLSNQSLIQRSAANALQPGLQILMLTLQDTAFQRWELQHSRELVFNMASQTASVLAT